MANREQIRERMTRDGIKYILTQFVDIHGAAKVKLVPASTFDNVVDDGAGFAGGSLHGMGQGPNDHDMAARIDIDSYTPLPWDPETARFASDLFVDGEPHPYCPRQHMKKVLGELRDQGFVFNVGIEPEHFLVQRNADGKITYLRP